MFEGWISFAGNELVNSARLAVYKDAGILPPGTIVRDCDECDTVADLAGDGPYNSPLQDDAPWVDPNNPSSWRFAGLQILGMSGVEDSTRTATTTEFISNGGFTGRPRNASRIIGVSALMMGADGEAINAGMSWLKAVLRGDDCGGSTPCSGSQLCMVSGCPEVCDQSTDPAEPMNTYPIALNDLGWEAFGGVYTPDGKYIPPPGGGILAGPVQTMYDEVEITFSAYTVGGDNTVWVGMVDENGVPLEQGDTMGLNFYGLISHTSTNPWPKWRPAIFVDGPGIDLDFVELRHRRYLTVEECLDPYLRMYERVTTIDGPRIVGTEGSGCSGSGLARVEWTWHVGNPSILHQPRVLAAEINSRLDVPPVYVAPGVTVSEPDLVVQEDTQCPAPAAPVSMPCSDPCCADLDTPPTVPTVEDLCVSRPAPDDAFSRSIVQIPASYVPAQSDGMLNISFYANGQPKIGVRVRVYPDPLGLGFEQVEECDFCAEWNITYIPGQGRYIIDSAHDQALVSCPGDTDGYDRADTLRGRDYSPFFDFPVLACGVSHMVVVDVPLHYPKDCPPDYTQFGNQGALLWGLAIQGRDD